MTIEKAIEILAHLSTAGAPKITLDEIIATKLGIEALKVIKEDRQCRTAFVVPRLPGETEE